MQGIEAGLLLALCSAVCVLCVYTKKYSIAFVVLFFGDFLAIQGKIFFGYQALGIYKEGILLALGLVLIIFVRQSFSDRSFLGLSLFFACAILAISADYRPFSALFLAAIVGALVGKSGAKIDTPILALVCISLSICTYQFINITEFNQLWFYEFLSEKAGDEFLSTYHAYFRNDRIRPPGFLVSPSTFGFVFILISFLVEKSGQRISIKLVTKILCFAGLLMIQTRALLIIFLAFEIQQRFFPRLRDTFILLYYFFILALTIAATVIFGDEGSLVRILLFTGLITDLISGIGILPFASSETAPVDSQFVSFIRAFGVLGFVLIYYMISLLRQRKLGQLYESGNTELAFLCVLLFINIFQWSESSPGHLLGWLMLAYFHNRRIRVRYRSTHQPGLRYAT